MTINGQINETELTVLPAGRLDTSTALQLEEYFKGKLDNVESLVMDFEELSYISSAGLRVLLSVQKKMHKKGGMVIRHVNDIINEVFEVTGFVDFLKIE